MNSPPVAIAMRELHEPGDDHGVLEPALAVLDETDSGLDVDAMKLVAEGVNALRDEGRGFRERPAGERRPASPPPIGPPTEPITPEDTGGGSGAVGRRRGVAGGRRSIALERRI